MPRDKLVYSKPVRFRELSEQLAQKVNQYWDMYAMPLPARVVWGNMCLRLNKEHRDEFKDHARLEVVCSALAQSGAEYLFPNAEKYGITNALIYDCMHKLAADKPKRVRAPFETRFNLTLKPPQDRDGDS